MNRSHGLAVAAWFAWIGLFGSALVGCSDVGDNTAGPGEDAAGDAAGLDSTAVDGEESETSSDGGAAPVDGQPSTGPVSVEGGEGMDASTDALVDAGLAATVDAGLDATVDTGLDATVGAGVDAGLDAMVDAGIDSGPGAMVDAGIDTGMEEAGVEAGMEEAGMEAGVDAGVDGGSCVAECPASNPACTNGENQGLGYPGCNATEALFNAHTSSKPNTSGLTCLQCVVNFGCLHDNTGDVPPAVYDCEDVAAGSDTFGGGNETNLATCLDILGCELSSNCATNNALYCYCGEGVNSTTCKTSQTGACAAKVAFGLESADPTFIQNNFSSLPPTPLPGQIADKDILCARNNCQAECF